MFETQWEIVQKFVFTCKSSVCILRVPDSVITDEFKKDFCVIDVCADFSPFKPFLSIISQNFNGSALEYVEKNAYSVQKDSFLSFIRISTSFLLFSILSAKSLIESSIASSILFLLYRIFL